MALVTRDHLAKQLAARADISVTAARDEVRWFFDTLASALEKGHEVRIHGFGNFRTAQRGARMGRNPRTAEPVRVPARRVIRFSPALSLSRAVGSTRRHQIVVHAASSEASAPPAPSPGPGTIPKRYPPKAPSPPYEPGSGS